MDNNNETLKLLAAKDSIRDLAAEYCHAVAATDLDQLMALFTESAFMNVTIEDEEGKFGKVEGKDALREFYTGMLSLAPKPFIHNHCITVDGDRATGKCSVEIRGLPEELTTPSGGYYEDSYAIENGEWKFENRTFFAY